MLVSNQDKGGFSILQQQIVENYLDGDMNYVSNIQEAQECGDGLLSFIINEAGDANDLSEFIRMMELAQRQLGDVSMALAKIHETSLIEAVALAGEKVSHEFVNVDDDKTYDGAIMGVTKNHVVQSLGRTAVIHEKGVFSRVPEKGEAVSVAYDGQGSAKVADNGQGQSVSR